MLTTSLVCECGQTSSSLCFASGFFRKHHWIVFRVTCRVQLRINLSPFVQNNGLNVAFRGLNPKTRGRAPVTALRVPTALTTAHKVAVVKVSSGRPEDCGRSPEAAFHQKCNNKTSRAVLFLPIRRSDRYFNKHPDVILTS